MQQQGEVGIERLCQLACVSRAGYYRHWQAQAPREEETELRDAVQRSALKNRKYGHRRITADLQRAGWLVNKKRILRIMREDNLLCVPKRAFVPPTTNSRHSWRIYPNLARQILPMAESFMRTLKNEEVDGRQYRDLTDAEASIGHFIETVYNRQRLHSALSYRPPAEFEERKIKTHPGSGHAQTPDQQVSTTSA